MRQFGQLGMKRALEGAARPSCSNPLDLDTAVVATDETDFDSAPTVLEMPLVVVPLAGPFGVLLLAAMILLSLD